MATVKSGFLQKLTGLLKRDWKRRYFVLYQDGELVYYERAGIQQSDGRLSVKHGCHRIDYAYEVEQDVQKKVSGQVDCLFAIQTSQKTVFLVADTDQDARDWVQKLKEIRQSAGPTGSYGVPVPGMNQPGMPYPGRAGMPYPNSQSGMPYYPNSQSGMPYPNNQSGMPYPNNQSRMPYPNNQSGMPYPNSQPGMPYPSNQPGMPYSASQSGMLTPYPVGTAYPGQPAPYTQTMVTAPYQGPGYVQYQNTPQYYQTQPGGYVYPAYQQQQVYQSGRSRSSKRGLMTGAAGGALAGGLLGFGMGRAVGGFGGGFDGCDSDFGGCDFGGCD